MIRRLATSVVSMTATIVVLGALAPVSDAIHVKPKGATPVLVALVLDYQECLPQNANRIRQGDPAALSCNPPLQSSPNVWVGSPQANGAASNFMGKVRLDVCPVPGCSAPDVRMEVSLSDVRCRPAAQPCGSPNTSDGPDYTGELQVSTTYRTTDHASETNPPSCPFSVSCRTATLIDSPLRVTVPCVETTDTSVNIGSNCAIVVSLNSLIPGFSVANAQSNTRLDRIDVFDGGPDGVVATAGNSPFMAQGIFSP